MLKVLHPTYSQLKDIVMKLAAKLIQDHKLEIIAEWENEVRRRISAASNELESVLVNTLPILIINLAEAVDKNDSAKLAVDGSTIAGDHGGERANLTKYLPENIILEYNILRQTIFNLLEKHQALAE